MGMIWKKFFTTSMLSLLVSAIGATALMVAPTNIQAQTDAETNAMTLTLALPSFMSASDAQVQAVAQPFEQAHPGVTVKVINKDPILPSPADGLDNYFKAL